MIKKKTLSTLKRGDKIRLLTVDKKVIELKVTGNDPDTKRISLKEFLGDEIVVDYNSNCFKDFNLLNNS